MPFREHTRGFWEIFFGVFSDEDGNPLADWSMKSPNSVHKHEIFVQDFPESLIANEHLNRAIHDAVGRNASGIPRIEGCCEFSDRHYIDPLQLLTIVPQICPPLGGEFCWHNMFERQYFNTWRHIPHESCIDFPQDRSRCIRCLPTISLPTLNSFPNFL